MPNARHKGSQAFKIAPASPSAIRRLRAITLLLGALTLLSGWAWTFGTESAIGWWIMFSCTVLAAGTGVFFAGETYMARSRLITITRRHLRVQRIFRDITVPLERLRLKEAGMVSIRDDSPLHPAFRSYGISIDGYRTGWFRLRNGEKAFLALSSLSPVVHIPTRNSYPLLLSVDHPEALLSALQNQCSRDTAV